MVKIVKKIALKILSFVFSFTKVESDYIVFFSSRNRVDGNPKEIYKYLKKYYNKKYKLFYIIKKDMDKDIIDEKDVIFYHTLKSYYLISKAKYWILSDSVKIGIKKKKNQIYIQTFHGHGPTKKGVLEVEKIRKELGVTKVDHVKEWDLYISMCQEDESHIINSTGYDGQILRSGISSTDPIVWSNQLSMKEINKLKDKYHIPKDKIVVLYAPTYREDLLTQDNIKLNVESLKELKDYVFLLRLHPLLNSKIDKKIFDNSNFINCCDGPDIVDLYPVVDILISDYSAAIYEFAVTNKKIVCYPFDYDKYDEFPGILIDYEKVMPGPICYNEQELFNVFSNLSKAFKNYDASIKEFNEKYNYLNDGYATERFVNKLISGEIDKIVEQKK